MANQAGTCTCPAHKKALFFSLLLIFRNSKFLFDFSQIFSKRCTDCRHNAVEGQTKRKTKNEKHRNAIQIIK
jgi:hypothetical protein